MNAPYYATYASAYREHPFGRSPLTADETKRWELLTGTKPDARSTNVSFTRPELSPILSTLDGASYDEALALLSAGQQRLAERPRADMPGFDLVDPTEIAQQTRYEQRLRAESEMRQAIIDGQRRYETKP